MNKSEGRPIEILLVEDSPSDTDLTLEALKDFKVRNHVSVVEDGVQAMQFLRRQGPYAEAPRPDLIMLDLNLPRKDGREVLAEIKADDNLKTIPIVVLTTSRAEQDILRAYQLNANCYITKPVDFNQFLEVVRSIESFWLFVVTLPPAPKPAVEPAPGSCGHSRPSMNAAPVRVLLVEDSASDALLLQESLAETRPGEFDFTHVECWAEAAQCLRQQRVRRAAARSVAAGHHGPGDVSARAGRSAPPAHRRADRRGQ